RLMILHRITVTVRERTIVFSPALLDDGIGLYPYLFHPDKQYRADGLPIGIDNRNKKTIFQLPSS
ncbi:hypothetical protein EQJ88_25910, partial [Escherichia coli]|nr:hypothetical protein [Escherichia coli]